MDGLRALGWWVVRMLNSELGFVAEDTIEFLGGYDISFV